MKNYLILLFFFGSLLSLHGQTISITDDFEGGGTVPEWVGDDCQLNPNRSNPFVDTANPSATVLEYHDTGGAFANVRFDAQTNFVLSGVHSFSLKIFVPSSGLTGNQPNQISLKLQNGNLPAPWSSQSEIIKPLEVDVWQTVTFNFATDDFINLDPNSPPPTSRTDFNRMLLQLNGENNNDRVLAYIDDFSYEAALPDTPSFDCLVWADEFSGEGAIDGDKWFHQTQLPLPGGWFNGEIQHYTNRQENSYVDNGTLKIVAQREQFTDQGVTKNFTSARLNSKFAFTYGRVDIRAKLPTGVGTWPALWMLGRNIDEDGGYWDNQGFGTTPWPACGEIDIMEHWGDNQNYVSSAMHTPSSFGGTVNVGGTIIPTASMDFHVYTMIWTEEKIEFSVDGIVHYTYNPPIKDASTWPFDAPQYLLFNVAMLPNVTNSFVRSALEVDYVRVYESCPTSTEETEFVGNLRAYPNPVGDELRLDLPEGMGAGRLALRVVDAKGRVIRRFSQDAGGSVITVSGLAELPPGVYFLVGETEGQLFRAKFVKR
ncbi:family 16 glycosylhydrolase [Lewinella sp. W8]|uniref:family 16 glycosylhydrolase n=1 Tax=Lewinella sp. W8 TaxID=2528208 RepID=UPI001067EF4F|nr:family 16 glycosylhydrolase [Lewinella sp. W8]